MIAKQRDDDSTKLAAEDCDLLHRQIKLHQEQARRLDNKIRINDHLLGGLYERMRNGD